MTTSRSDRRGARGREKPERAPNLDPAASNRATFALGACLVALVALRAVSALVPGMSAWGFNAARFLPAAGWALWALAALALIPPLARPLAAPLVRFGDTIASRPMSAALALALLVMALVVALPDRLWLMGDFLLRLGCTRGQLPVEIVFPQALPLDLRLHHHFPVLLASMGVADPNSWERLLGALEAAALAGLAVVFARGLGLRGAAAAAAAASIALTGLLGMFTGYGKGLVELTLLTVAVGVLALSFVRDGRGAWPLAIAIITALTVHRSAITLLAVPPVAGLVAWRELDKRSATDRASTLVALGAPFIATAMLSSRLIAAMKVTDAKHLAPTGSGPAAILGAAFAPGHLLDVLNLIGQMTPLLVAAPVLAIALGRALASRRREWSVLLALAVPAVLVLLFVHPRQGLFRDYDVFAPSLAALSLVTALLVGDALREAPARAWLSVALVLGVAGAGIGHLLLQDQIKPGFKRIEAYLDGPPLRTADERALLWSYVAERELSLGLKDESVAAFAKAAELAPSPRILFEWAMAEQDRHDWAAAREVYRKLARRNPGFPDAWIGIASTSLNLGDRAEAERTALVARQLDPTRPEPVDILHALGQRDSLRAPR